jgi:Fe-S-cluster containining protein
MAAFECDRCGKCCVSLGPLITIERQLNDRDYYCRCKVDNAIFLASVDPAYRDGIDEEFLAYGHAQPAPEKKACRFLRREPDGNGAVCAIYASRPKICRDFRCYRMIIRNLQGDVCGRVIGKNTIRTEDVALEDLWNGQLKVIPYGDPAAWRENVTRILAGYGYRAESVE